jgi:hypothetical protein
MLANSSGDLPVLAPTGCALQAVADSNGKAISLWLIDADAGEFL